MKIIIRTMTIKEKNGEKEKNKEKKRNKRTKKEEIEKNRSDGNTNR